MTTTELQAHLRCSTAGRAATVALDEYVASFFPVILAAHRKYQEALDAEFPGHWPHTVHSDDHLANLFDLFESFELTDTLLSIRTWESFRGEYDYKVETFPRAIFDETDDNKRAVLINDHFAALAQSKRIGFQGERSQRTRAEAQNTRDWEAETHL